MSQALTLAAWEGCRAVEGRGEQAGRGLSSRPAPCPGSSSKDSLVVKRPLISPCERFFSCETGGHVGSFPVSLESVIRWFPLTESCEGGIWEDLL